MSSAFVRPRRSDLQAMIRLAGPVVVVQVGLMLMGVVDTMVVGRLSAQALAAVALGNLIVLSVAAFGMGLLMALDPLVAQAVGARDTEAIRRAVQRGMVLAAAITIPSALVLMPGEYVLPLLRQPAEIIPVASGYARICIAGLLPFFMFVVLRQTLQALEKVRPIVLTIIVANIFNLGADYVLVFGWGPVPAMGALGSAWATTASRWLLLFVLIFMARAKIVPLMWPFRADSLGRGPLWQTFKLGAPIGIQIQLEFAVFGVVALLMGGFGTIEMAAHQVAVNLASLTFMVPLGVSAAAAVRVGHAVGAQDPEGIQRATSAALVCGAGFMTMTAALFLFAPMPLAAAYTPVAEVLALAVVFIPIAGFFQVFDGLQVVSAGILRGLGDTRAPVVVNLLGFWLVGMPVSLALAFPLGFGPAGLWWGLVAGLGAVAVFLLLRIRRQLRRDQKRVEVE
ncbi:MAG: MATE family efflux transporter [Thermoanaerobaculales bacterium]|nr:MATE family efflux transporter [Thermoanaerobaculales bacterium]